MASLTIKIDSGDAAFDGRENAAYEMVRILRKLIQELEAGREPYHPLHDVNGNKCGSVYTDLGEDDGEDEGDAG